MPLCPDCGAAIANGSTCRAMFDELLAHEYAFPASFGAVHHLTVAAYYLQHPHGHSRAVVDGWRTIIAESLDGLATPAEFLRRARARSGERGKVREPGAEPPEGWPRSWPMGTTTALGSGQHRFARRWRRRRCASRQLE